MNLYTSICYPSTRALLPCSCGESQLQGCRCSSSQDADGPKVKNGDGGGGGSGPKVLKKGGDAGHGGGKKKRRR